MMQVKGKPWTVDYSNLLRFYGAPNKLCLRADLVTADMFADLEEEERVTDLIENFENHGLVAEDR